MKILDVLNSPWAILPQQLSEITEIYATHLRGEKIDLRPIEAALGKPLENEEQGYQILHGVAIVPVHGVLSKRMNMFSRISGGASTELLARDIRQALDDPRVGALVLDIDSPGGQVDGVQTLADQIYEARGSKPIVAFADGKMASGAYWIGSAAEEIYLSGETVIVGSIGVVTQHVDYSKMEERVGIKTTEITAGKYKRIASEHAPLTDDGRAYIQSQIDEVYTVMVNSIARNRGVDADTVLKNMADGRLFIGKQAINAGLADGVSTLDALISDLLAGRKPTRSAVA